MEHFSLLLSHIREAFERHERLVLALVLSRTGSGPREPGSKLLLLPDGRCLGTVGGGELEHTVTRRARELPPGGPAEILSFEMTNTATAAAGMMCGGRAEVLLDPLDPDRPALAAWARRARMELDARQPFHLLWALTPGDGGLRVGHGLCGPGWSLFEPPADLGDDTWEFILEKRATLDPRQPKLLEVGRGRFFSEPVFPPETVLVFGAGHIAEKLAPLCALAEFRVTVLDDRPEFASPARFPQADRVLAVDRYEGCLAGLALDPACYVVIVTHGHLHDRTVLAQALRSTAGYIGMIGSRRKWAVIRQSLLEEGFTEADLARVHCPIGLEIGAETPAEIAVSIISEIVAVRHRFPRPVSPGGHETYQKPAPDCPGATEPQLKQVHE